MPRMRRPRPQGQGLQRQIGITPCGREPGRHARRTRRRTAGASYRAGTRRASTGAQAEDLRVPPPLRRQGQ
eukprot:5525773-Lingulodinium_polyedra.AAC.1